MGAKTDEIKTLLSEIGELPTLPTIYTSILEVMSNPRSYVTDVAQIIEKDVAISTKILKTVNSPIFARPNYIETINDAIFQLGFAEVKNLTLAISVMDMFKNVGQIRGFTIIDIWKHSIGTAVITRAIGKLIGIKNIENYFLAGLLHDIGKIIFFKFFPEQYQEVVKTLEIKRLSIAEAEKNALGFDHMDVGKVLGKLWNMPPSIVNVIAWHENGLVGGKENLLNAAVHLADILANVLSFGISGDYVIRRPNPAIWQILKLEKGDLTKQVPKLKEAYEKSIQILIAS